MFHPGNFYPTGKLPCHHASRTGTPTASGISPASLNAFKTPIWAAPLAPPPARARPYPIKSLPGYSSSRETVLVYSSDTPEKVREYQKLGREKVAAMLEGATAELAVRAVKAGYSRIISAGGETSGAVTKGLGFSSYWLGESVAPGVPIMVPTERPDIRLILKSGNFGQEDFFGRALAMTEKP